MANELKPCPFCGAYLEASAAFSTRGNTVYVHPVCEELCVTQFIVGTSDSQKVAAWNRRSVDPLDAAQIAELQAEVEAARFTVASLEVEVQINAGKLSRAKAQIADLKRALDTARHDAMEEAAKLLEEGYDRVPGTSYRSDGVPSKNDQCAHGTRGWEDCEECAVAAIRALKTGAGHDAR